MKLFLTPIILAAAVSAASAGQPTATDLNSMNAEAVRATETAGLPQPSMARAASAAYGSEDLPKSSRVRRAAEETDSAWGDENIMNGVAHVRSGRMVFDGGVTADRLNATAAEYTKAYFEYYEDARLKSPVKAASGMKLRQAVDLAALNIAKGFFYDTSEEENVEPLRSQINELAALLGPAGEITALTASSKAVIEDIGGGALEVGMVILVNSRTGEYLAFFSREGNG